MKDSAQSGLVVRRAKLPDGRNIVAAGVSEEALDAAFTDAPPANYWIGDAG